MGYPYGIIQLSCQSIIKPLFLLYKNCYESSSFPAEWKKSCIIPIHKKVDKQLVLALVDELTVENAKAKAFSVSHSEDVSAWVAAISAKRKSAPQRLIDLQQQLKMPLIEVWIALLLGGFQLEQRGEFYELEGIWLH